MVLSINNTRCTYTRPEKCVSRGQEQDVSRSLAALCVFTLQEATGGMMLVLAREEFGRFVVERGIRMSSYFHSLQLCGSLRHNGMCVQLFRLPREEEGTFHQSPGYSTEERRYLVVISSINSDLSVWRLQRHPCSALDETKTHLLLDLICVSIDPVVKDPCE